MQSPDDFFIVQNSGVGNIPWCNEHMSVGTPVFRT